MRVAREWQRRAVEVAQDAQYFAAIAPGGSGKSLVQCMAGAIDIERTGNKQLVLVPQSHIHHGFYGGGGRIDFRLAPGGRLWRWEVGHNFCVGKNDLKAERLREFLLAGPADLRRRGGLAAVATHKAVVAAWEGLSGNQRRRAVRNITFRPDEAHHASDVFEDADLDEFDPARRQDILGGGTKLGAILRYCVNANCDTNKVHLSTATLFRGDRRVILSDAARERFRVFQLPWDEHYESLKLDGFRFDFRHYGGSPLGQVLDAVRRERTHRHLVILPALTRRFRHEATVAEWLAGLGTVYPEGQILDLVTPKTQPQNKALLLKHPERFHAVVACRLFDEGTDWVVCDRMHNTDACERSMTLAVQRFFRPFRPHPQKKTVRIDNYLPEFTEGMDVERKRRVLSDRLNALLACLVTNGELVPCLVPVEPAARGGDGAAGGTSSAGGRNGLLPLQELYGHDRYVELMTDLVRGYESLDDKSDPAGAVRVVEAVVDDYGVPAGADPDGLKAALEALLVRVANPEARTIDPSVLTANGFDAGSIARNGFDKVWARQGQLDSALRYGTENITGATFRELLGVIERPLTLAEIHAGIRGHHARTGRRLTYKTGWIDELETTSMAVEKLLRRSHDSTLATEVNKVLGFLNDGLLEKTREVINLYAGRGERLGLNYGFIPEMGITSYALNARLLNHYGTTLAAEVEKVMGPLAAEITVEKVRQVIKAYAERGVTLGRKYGFIPELNVTSYAVHDRLRRHHGISLSDVVAETLGVARETGLGEVRNLIRQYRLKGETLTRSMGLIPELGVTVNALNLRLKKYGTTLAEQTKVVLAEE